MASPPDLKRPRHVQRRDVLPPATRSGDSEGFGVLQPSDGAEVDGAFTAWLPRGGLRSSSLSLSASVAAASAFVFGGSSTFQGQPNSASKFDEATPEAFWSPQGGLGTKNAQPLEEDSASLPADLQDAGTSDVDSSAAQNVVLHNAVRFLSELPSAMNRGPADAKFFAASSASFGRPLFCLDGILRRDIGAALCAKLNIAALFPWQDRMLREHPEVLCSSTNVVFRGPTSCGKTLVALILAAKVAVERGLRVIYVAPLRINVHEVSIVWRGIFEPLGLTVHGFASDTDAWRSPTPPDVSVCTFEMGNSVLGKLSDAGQLSSLGLVVADEIHMVSDRNRGLQLELFVSKAKFLQEMAVMPKAQIIAMTGTIADDSLTDVERWLNGSRFQCIRFSADEDDRPVQLSEVLVCCAQQHSVSGCPGNHGSQLVDIDRCAHEHIEQQEKRTPNCVVINDAYRELLELWEWVVFDQIVQLRQRSQSALVFGFKKNEAYSGAWRFASWLKSRCIVPTISDELQEQRRHLVRKLKDSEAHFDHSEHLSEMVLSGIAFHHAELSVEAKDLIEAGFRDGRLFVIFCTTTLAIGVNLPAHVVIIAPTLKPVSASKSRRDFGTATEITYKQMAGRAGRAGFKDVPHGTVLVFSKECAGAMHRQSSWIQGQIRAMQSALLKLSDAEMLKKTISRPILDLIASRVILKNHHVSNFLAATFGATLQSKMSEIRTPTLEAAAEHAITYLLSLDFIVREEETQSLHATLRGRAVASSPWDCDHARDIELFVRHHLASYGPLTTNLGVSYLAVNPILRDEPFLSVRQLECLSNFLWRDSEALRRAAMGLSEADLRFCDNELKLNVGTLTMLAQARAGVESSFFRQSKERALRLLRAIVLLRLQNQIDFRAGDLAFLGIRPSFVASTEDNSKRYTRQLVRYFSALGDDMVAPYLKVLRDRIAYRASLKFKKLLKACPRNLGIASLHDSESAQQTISFRRIAISRLFEFNVRNPLQLLEVGAEGVVQIVDPKRDVPGSYIWAKSLVSEADDFLNGRPSDSRATDALPNIDLKKRTRFAGVDLGRWYADHARCCWSDLTVRSRRVLLSAELDLWKQQSRFAFAISSDGSGICGIAVSWETPTLDGNEIVARYFPFNLCRKAIVDIMSNTNTVKVCFRMATTLRSLFLVGVQVCGTLEDPGIAWWILAETNPGSEIASAMNLHEAFGYDSVLACTLGFLVCRYLPDSASLFANPQPISDTCPGNPSLSLEACWKAAASHASMMKLNRIFADDKFRCRERLYRTMEMPNQRVIARMLFEGLPLSQERVTEGIKLLLDQMQHFREIYDRLAQTQDLARLRRPTSPHQVPSPSQIRELLATIVGPEFMNKGTGKEAFSILEEQLSNSRCKVPDPEKIQARQVVHCVQKMRTAAHALELLRKIANLPYYEDGRVHGQLEHLPGISGRFAFHGLNLHAIPRELLWIGPEEKVSFSLRGVFCADPGWCLASFDYKSFELRLLAFFSQDESLIEALLDADRDSVDIFSLLASSQLHCSPSEVTATQRRQFKQQWYALMYGRTAQGLARELQVADNIAERKMQDIVECYPGVAEWIRHVRSIRDDFAVTLGGRRCFVPLFSENAKSTAVSPEELQAARIGVNRIVQGSAADIKRQAMVRVAAVLDKQWGDTVRRPKLIHEMHDELLLESPLEDMAVLSALVNEVMSTNDIASYVTGIRAHDVDRIVRLPEGKAMIQVPLRVRTLVGRSWGEAQPNSQVGRTTSNER